MDILETKIGGDEQFVSAGWTKDGAVISNAVRD
jgi:hypothetical protein